MSEPENFVARWSRLKREKAQHKDPPGTSGPDPMLDDPAQGQRAAPTGERCAAPQFDVSSLPSIESLTAGSDIRAFLQSGVPAELTKAALRKVWTTDPAIRDFIGIAENQWDFTDPTAMPGFGPLTAGDDVAKLVAQAMGKLGDAARTDAAATAANAAKQPTTACEERRQALGTPPLNETSASQDRSIEEQQAGVSAAAQHDEPSAKVHPIANRRTHGRALPR